VPSTARQWNGIAIRLEQWGIAAIGVGLQNAGEVLQMALGMLSGRHGDMKSLMTLAQFEITSRPRCARKLARSSANGPLRMRPADVALQERRSKSPSEAVRRIQVLRRECHHGTEATDSNPSMKVLFGSFVA